MEKRKNLLLRSCTGFALVSVMLFCIQQGSWYLSVLFAVLLAFSIFELVSILKKLYAVNALGIYVSAFMFYGVLVSLALGILDWSWVGVFLLAPFVLFAWELFRPSKNPLEQLALAVFSAYYLGVGYGMLFALPYMGLDYDPTYLFALFFFIWTYDSFAYLTGMLFGKHKLFERISPKKTWQGAIGGMLFALLCAWVWAQNVPSTLHDLDWLLLGFAVALLATLGDLAESMLKRAFQVKDTSNFLPGHGGFLDRFDSAIFSAPFFYFLCKYLLER
jgi:phosphatidate cytidylyltransferase